jgi:TrmH family RNA methyltransferase
MISKNKLKYYSSLLRKKNRDIEKKFLAEGLKTVEEGLRSGFSCETVLVTDQFEQTNKGYLKQYSIQIETVEQNDFNKLTETVTPQGITAVFDYPPQLNPEFITSNPVVCLENISDPGNLGTIIRNCDWFGIKDIVLSKNCTDVLSPKTVRSTMGSLFHVNLYKDIELTPWIQLVKKKDYRIICADMEGENLFSIPKSKKDIIILSSESHGPSNDILSLSDLRVTIPKYGSAESLNVASASAVILSSLVQMKL